MVSNSWAKIESGFHVTSIKTCKKILTAKLILAKIETQLFQNESSYHNKYTNKTKLSIIFTLKNLIFNPIFFSFQASVHFRVLGTAAGNVLLDPTSWRVTPGQIQIQFESSIVFCLITICKVIIL